MQVLVAPPVWVGSIRPLLTVLNASVRMRLQSPPAAICLCVADNVRIAVLLPMSGAWPVGPLLIGALALAVRDVNADPTILHGKRLEYVWRDDGCDRLTSLAEFSDMLGRFGPIDGLIGPGCDKGCEITATLAESNNIPQISPTCAAPSLSNKAEFPLFVRTTSPYAKWAPAIVAFMRWAAWTRLSIVGDAAMVSSVGPLRAEVDRSGLQLSSELQFQADHFEAASGDPSPLASVRAAGVRVVMVYAFIPDYRAIAVEARRQDMSQGWAWMGIDMVSGAELVAHGHDLAVAQAALHGWIYFAPAELRARTSLIVIVSRRHRSPTSGSVSAMTKARICSPQTYTTRSCCSLYLPASI